MLRSKHFGTLLQMEVGAMLVGRICNLPSFPCVSRGQEKGFFQYGGSTIILLVQKDMIRIPDSLIGAQEVPVRMGEMIAQAARP